MTWFTAMYILMYVLIVLQVSPHESSFEAIFLKPVW